MDFKTGSSTVTEWKTPPRVCRCCLSEGCYKDISTEYYWMGEKELYSEMLKECFDITIKVQENTSSARLICEVCITRLRDASNFKKQVVMSEKRFAEHLQTGISLSMLSENASVEASLAEIKIESIKDETVISDDDPPDGPDDFDDDDLDYDESDSLPLKFEALKKEAMAVELAFGDEIPVLNNPEMTIRRVSSKTKEKKETKKIKVSKKELTIKPVKASSSKTKSKEEKVKKEKVKQAKAAKKGDSSSGSSNAIEQNVVASDSKEEMLKRMRELDKAVAMRVSLISILESSHVCPFKWQKNRYRCFYCDTFFLDPSQLRQHNAVQHIKPNVAKAIKQIRKNHLAKIDVTRTDCKLCDEPIHDFDALKHHIAQIHGRKIDPNYSDGALPFRLTLDLLTCEVCQDTFTEFKTLMQHMNVHYRNYTCETCGAGFISPDRLKTHGLSHEKGSIPCEECDKVFRSTFAKNEHVASVHRQVKRHRCPHCPEAFRNYFQRNKHMTLFHNVKRKEYACSLCLKTFSSSGKLSHHIKTVHLKEKRLTCDICSWKVYSKSELNDHMIKHGGARIHQCTICKKSYARKYTLREHMRIHNNDRRFACAVCGKTFVQNCSLKHHMKVHHPESGQYRTQVDGSEESAMRLYCGPE